MSERIRVLIADDQAAVRMAIAETLKCVEGVEIVGLAVNGEQAVELTIQLQPDVVVMDVRMPGVDGIEATRRIVSSPSVARTVGLSVHEDEVGDDICDAGAVTFIPKLCEAAVLADAIRFAAESPPRKPR